MTKLKPIHLAAFLSVVASYCASAQITFANWTDSLSGNLNGVSYTVTYTGAGGSLSSQNYNNTYWDNAGSTTGLDFDFGNTSSITVSFSSAVSDLRLFAYYWRGPGSFGPSTVTVNGGTFSLNANASSGSASGNTVTIDSTTYAYFKGILEFSTPVTTLTISPDSSVGSTQGLTLGTLTSPPTPVPEASGSVAGLGLVMAGLYQLGRRRQKTVTQ